METPKPAIYATQEASNVADIDVDIDKLATAADSLGYTAEQIESLTLGFDTAKDSTIHSLIKPFWRKKEIHVGQLDDATNTIEIYPSNIAKLVSKNRNPLIATEWARTDTAPNVLANQALADGMYRLHEFVTIPEIFKPEPYTGPSVNAMLARIPESLTSGYALAVHAAVRDITQQSEKDYQRDIEMQRKAAIDRAKRFANSHRAVNLLSSVIHLDYK